MDASLYPTLKAGILALTDPTFVALRNEGATGQMADWLNQNHATEKAWNSAASWEAVQNAIEYAKYTPSVANTPSDTAGLCKMVAILLKLTVQQNMLIGMQQRIDATDAGTVDALLDTVIQVPSGLAGALTSPGGASGVNVANALTRPARRGEVIFGGNVVQKGTVSARVLAWQGQVTDHDVIRAINLPG